MNIDRSGKEYESNREWKVLFKGDSSKRTLLGDNLSVSSREDKSKEGKKGTENDEENKGKIAGDKIKPGRENRDGKGRGEGGRRREKEVGGSGGSGGILTVLRKVKKESVIFDGETMESEMRGGRDERGLEDVVEGRGRKRE